MPFKYCEYFSSMCQPCVNCSTGIGVVPITHVSNKKSSIQGRSPNVVKVIGTSLKGKNSPPLGANSFL